jgi:hypothetical protein
VFPKGLNRSNSATPSVKPRRKLKLLPARLKALRLHGRYLGYMRQLKSRAKAEVRALRAKKGVGVAIARARKMAAKCGAMMLLRYVTDSSAACTSSREPARLWRYLNISPSGTPSCALEYAADREQ